MATRVWSSSSSTDMNDGANYSGSGALLVTDDLVFNNTSVVNATATAALSVKSITISNTYTGVFNDGGKVFTIAGLVSISSGGGVTCTGSWSQTADANFILSASTSWNIATMSLDLQATGNLTIVPSNLRVGNLTLAASGKTTTITGGSSTTGAFISLTIGAGTLNLSGNSLFFSPANINALTINPSATITGSRPLDIFASGLMLNLPTITMTGTTTLNCRTGSGAGSGFNQNGTINVPNFIIQKSSTGAFTYNTNNNAIIVTNTFNIGSTNATNILTANFGSSNVIINIFTTNVSVTGDITLELDSSSWVITGNCTISTKTTINDGSTSYWTFNGTSNQTITTNTEILPQLTLDNSSSIILADNMSCYSLQIECTLNTATFSVTVIGDVIDNIGTTFYRLILTKPTTRTVTVNAGSTITLTNLTDTNINGSTGALTTWRSNSTGNRFYLDIPAPITLNYQDVQDCEVSEIVTVNDGTSINNGNNNSNWVFPDLVGAFKRLMLFIRKRL